MYRTGLGDCFLLCFAAGPKGPPAAVLPAFVLIDCGVFKGTPNGSSRIKKIADDIFSRNQRIRGRDRQESTRAPGHHS